VSQCCSFIREDDRISRRMIISSMSWILPKFKTCYVGHHFALIFYSLYAVTFPDSILLELFCKDSVKIFIFISKDKTDSQINTVFRYLNKVKYNALH